MTKVYCTAPWNGLAIREDGHVKTCCNGGVSLGNLNNINIKDIEQSQLLKEIQQNMLNGEPDLKNCISCVKQEKNTGIASLRQHYLRYYPNVEQNNIALKCLDVRWNNSCNLGCMYCLPQFSSVWENKLLLKKSTKVKDYQTDLLNFILEKIDQVEEIMLVGGEPMLMKQNYELIAKLPDTTKLNILTNLSYDLENLPCIQSLLKRPETNTTWTISCENVNEQFEYVRNGAKWNQFEKNLKFLNQHWNDNVSFNMVYSMFNAFDVLDVIQTFHMLGFKKFNFQTYFGHPAMDVFAMPGPIQQHAKECLQSSVKFHYNNIHPEDWDLYPMSNVNEIISKLNDNQSFESNVTFDDFLKRIEWYDQWTDLRFRNIWPNLINLVQQHLE